MTEQEVQKLAKEIEAEIVSLIEAVDKHEYKDLEG